MPDDEYLTGDRARAVRPAEPGSATPTALQSSLGNRAVVRMLQREEASEEEEMQAKHDPSLAQREVAPEEEAEMQGERDPSASLAQRAPEVGMVGGAASSGLSARIDAPRGGGRSLESGTRGSMEGALGASLDGVKVHVGEESDQLNHAITAKAFTTGNDVFVRSGQLAPGSSSTQRLLAHVVQQRSMSGDGGGMSVGAADTAEEREADGVADAVAQRHAAGEAEDAQQKPLVVSTTAHEPAPVAHRVERIERVERVERVEADHAGAGPAHRSMAGRAGVVFALQGSIGNRAVARILQRTPDIQRKDRTVDHAAGGSPAHVIQREPNKSVDPNASGPNASVDPMMSKATPGMTGPPVPAEDMKLVRILDVAKNVRLMKKLEYIPPSRYPNTGPTITVPGVNTPADGSKAPDPKTPTVWLGTPPTQKPFDPLKSPYNGANDSDEVKEMLADVGLKSSDELPSYYDQFAMKFQQRTHTIALFMLATNKDIATKEASRYDTKGESQHLRDAAKKLAKVQSEIFQGKLLLDTKKKLGQEFADNMVAKLKELTTLKAIYGTQFPILLADGIVYKTVAAADDKALKGLVAATTDPVIKNIGETERNIQSGKLDPMNLPPVVEQTKKNFEAGAGSEAATHVGRIQAQRAHEAAMEALGLGALTIALGLLAAAPTGGLSLLAAMGAAGAAGAAALSVKQFADSLEQYNMGKAAAGSAINSAAAIASEEPSLLWLAVDLAGACIDAGAALKAFRTVATTIKTAKAAGEVEKVIQVAVADMGATGKMHPSANRQQLAAKVIEDFRARRLIGERPANAGGLADKDAMGSFLAGTKQIATDAKLVSKQAKMGELGTLVNKMMTERGLPTIELKFPEGMPANTRGYFDPGTWAIAINPVALEKNGLEALATTLYHEARHSEQFTQSIRYQHDLLNMSAAEIAKKTGYKQTVVEAICDGKFGAMKVDHEMGRAMTTSMKMGTQRAHNEAMSALKTAREARVTSQVTKGLPKNATEEQILKLCEKDKDLEKLWFDELKASEKQKQAYKQYLDALHEVDARAVGDTVGAGLALAPK